MPKFIDLTGQRFGRLTVERRGETVNARTYWVCLCDCGTEKPIYASSLRSGVVQSCGCLHKEAISKINYKHGFSQTALYKVYTSMVQRCENKKHPSYKDYGARGISICDEWRQDRMTFINWAMSNGYAEGKSIDRIENDKGYYPSNCRWTDDKTQANNKRSNRLITIGETTKTLSEWLEVSGVPRRTFYERVEAGWSEAEAITKPLRKVRTQGQQAEPSCLYPDRIHR